MDSATTHTSDASPGRSEPANPLCEFCGYSLSEDPADRCPECGLTRAQRELETIRRRRRRARWLAVICGIALLPALIPLMLVAWVAFPNTGLDFGYYGRFNRALAAIRAIPGVAITKYGANEDTYLEEIWADVTVQHRWAVSVFIPQDVSWESARSIVVSHMDGVPLSKGAREWPGLAFSLGPDGQLRAIAGAESAADAIENIGRLAEFIGNNPLADLQAAHDVQSLPYGAIVLRVRDLQKPTVGGK